MPDLTLHGNGYSYPACEFQRETDQQQSVFGSTDTPRNQHNTHVRLAK